MRELRSLAHSRALRSNGLRWKHAIGVRAVIIESHLFHHRLGASLASEALDARDAALLELRGTRHCCGTCRGVHEEIMVEVLSGTKRDYALGVEYQAGAEYSMSITLWRDSDSLSSTALRQKQRTSTHHRRAGCGWQDGCDAARDAKDCRHDSRTVLCRLQHRRQRQLKR